MPSTWSDTSRESDGDIGATAVLPSTASPAVLGPRTHEKSNNKIVCLFELKVVPWERFVSGMRRLLVLVISSSTV